LKNKTKKIIVGTAIVGALAGIGGNEIYNQKQIGDFRDALQNRGIAEKEADHISRYFHDREGHITPEQQKLLTEAYNRELEEIRRDCERDARCKKGKVNLGNPESGKELIGVLNGYILDDHKNPDKYKIRK